MNEFKVRQVCLRMMSCVFEYESRVCLRMTSCVIENEHGVRPYSDTTHAIARNILYSHALSMTIVGIEHVSVSIKKHFLEILLGQAQNPLIIGD